MPSHINSYAYGQAILNHVQSGVYPESEEIISAQLPSSAISEISHLIEEAKEDVKVDIRRSSKNTAPDIDGWISQAKQLHIDIHRSQEIARVIVEQARQVELLEKQVQDASGKVHLLAGEIHFNDGLTIALGQLQEVQGALELAQRATLDDQLLEATDLLLKIDRMLTSLSILKLSTRISGILRAKVEDLRNLLVEKLTNCWNTSIHVSAPQRWIHVRQQLGGNSSIDLDALVAALRKMNLCDSLILSLCGSIESMLQSRLEVGQDATVSSMKIGDGDISMNGPSSDLSARSLFRDLEAVILFLRTNLPPSVVEPLAESLMPRLLARLIDTWLASAVPEDLQGMEDFKDTLTLVQNFGELLQRDGWPGKYDLMSWVKSIPHAWFRKRQELSLDRFRKSLSQGLGTTEIVERSETEVLSQDDEVFQGNGGGDDWDAGWSDDETAPSRARESSGPRKMEGKEGEEDISAWGLDDDAEDVNLPHKPEQPGAAEDDAEAWGWGDEIEGADDAETSQMTQRSAKKAKSSTIQYNPQSTQRTITLKETYRISSLPKEVLQIIDQVISDTASLNTLQYSSLPIASAAPDLLSLVGLILAMYRASAPTSYSHHSSGPMFLYNDTLWLAERLQQVPSDHTTALGKRIQTWTAYNLKLSEHVAALETFGKRAYAKEMESQRTIISDLLDGAQGFINCTEEPYAGECELAIASAVDRLRQLHRQWENVLSHSALLQSVGSLLSSITNKIIVDIEDLSDIPEPESHRLISFCNQIATLEDLFPAIEQAQNPSQKNEQSAMPSTALYASHWLKFQYLTNILESSLIDIKYLWMEGELGLEFDTEEVVDLVVALFADSPRRREAVAEIRGRRGVR